MGVAELTYPTSCKLYLTLYILFTVLNAILHTVYTVYTVYTAYTVLFTTLYNVHYTMFYTNAKVSGCDGLIPEEHFSSCL